MLNMFGNDKGRTDTKQWTVIGWFGPQKSSAGDRVVHLYPSIPGGAKFRCATLYQEHFYALPEEIRIPAENDPILPGSAPAPSDAKPLDQPFTVLTWINSNGSESKDVADIMDHSAAAQANPAGSTPASFGLQPASQPMEFNPLPEEEVLDSFGAIAQESLLKAQAVLALMPEVTGADQPDGSSKLSVMSKLSDEWHRMVASWAWRDANDQWRVVRPSLLRTTQVARPDGAKILAGERANFLDDLTAHPSVNSTDYARKICGLLGMEGSAEESVGRLVQAQRVWLFATLVDEPFSIERDRVLDIVQAVYPDDGVPF